MKSNSENQNSTNIPRTKKFIFILFSVFLAFLLTLALGELILRITPIPGIELNLAKFDELVGVGFHPHSITIYRNARGDFVKRKTNSYGYLDVEHKKEKRKGIYRIGLFGDSFVEARQVPLEDAFFRIVEKKLEDYNVECLAFGNSGFSTVQSYLNSKRWVDYFDLDLVVYVFCENDLGDQIREIKKDPDYPYAVLTENGFKIDNYFRKRNRFKQKIYFKSMDYLTAHSFVIATLVQRLKLLVKYGIKVKVSEEDRMMTTELKVKSIVNNTPNQGDLISSWPDSWREYAKELGSAVILKWCADVKKQSRKFAILYIPRNVEIIKEKIDQDWWKFWLESLCKENNIDFVDPMDNFLWLELSGKDVFYDHFTTDGHVAFADTFVKWFKKSSKIIEGRRR